MRVPNSGSFKKGHPPNATSFKEGCKFGERNKGKVRSEAFKANLSLKLRGRSMEGTKTWRGENASSQAKHSWIRKHFGKANKCENESCLGKSTVFDWANTNNHAYTRKREDYKMLCRQCHLKMDWSKKCRGGHNRTEENTYVYPNGHRRCRICQRNSKKARQLNKTTI